MDKVQVDIIQLQLLQTCLNGSSSVFGSPVSHPQLGGDEEVFSLYDSFLNSTLYCGTNKFVITITRGGINEAISDLDSIVNSVLTIILRSQKGSMNITSKYMTKLP